MPELLVTCGIGGEKRHVARLPGTVFYRAAFAGDPPPSWSCSYMSRCHSRVASNTARA